MLPEADVAECADVLRGVLVIALDGEAVGGVRIAEIGAEAGLDLVPAVSRAFAALELAGPAVERLGVDTESIVVAEFAAITRGDRVLLVATRRTHQSARGFLRLARDDVDDAVHRVRAPQGGARPADHLDAVDVVHDH